MAPRAAQRPRVAGGARDAPRPQQLVRDGRPACNDAARRFGLPQSRAKGGVQQVGCHATSARRRSRCSAAGAAVRNRGLGRSTWAAMATARAAKVSLMRKVVAAVCHYGAAAWNEWAANAAARGAALSLMARAAAPSATAASAPGSTRGGRWRGAEEGDDEAAPPRHALTTWPAPRDECGSSWPSRAPPRAVRSMTPRRGRCRALQLA